jgi:hypothetical protein
MKVGDLVKVPEARCNGIIVDIDDSHRQTTVTVMTEHGYILERVWSARVEVIDD